VEFPHRDSFVEDRAALAYGNCVVLKPADLVPGCAWALADIISRSGIPAGVFNLVMGRGSVIGDPLVNHPGIDAISFTGSQQVGSRIAQQCAVNLKKLQLEMGGKNPQVMLDDANLAQAVELSVQSAFFSTGQRCTASSRLIVTEGIYAQFVEAMKTAWPRLKVGDALAAGIDIGPVSSHSQLEQDLDYVAIGQKEGATLVAGGDRLKLRPTASTWRPHSSPTPRPSHAHQPRRSVRPGGQHHPREGL
jgi:acyl-CoA reductase-like NAD-dependent aldehyde dehydrogenase